MADVSPAFHGEQMKFKTSIPDEPVLGVVAAAGARAHPGKSNQPEESLRKGSLPQTEKVTTAECVDGAARDAIDIQVGQNGNPKKRDASGWGISRDMMKTAKKLD